MGIDKESQDELKGAPKTVYVKPVIKQVRLVPGESVLGACKLNNTIQDQCNLGELCFGYTPFS